MMRHAPAIIASLAASGLMFLAGYVYEGIRVRTEVTTKLELLQEAVKLLAERVRALEQARK